MIASKKLIPLTMAALMAGSTSAFAEISGNIGATSNYLWRGVTQTNDDAAVSGGIDYSGESGFYAGTWISNVAGGNETDFYLGFSGGSDAVEYTVGAIYYMYSQFDDADFIEVHGEVAFGGLALGAAYTVDGQADEDTSGFVEGDLYYYAGYGFDLQDDWSLGLTIGHYDFENDGAGAESYNHGQIDLGKSVGEFGDVTFTLSKSDIDGDDDPIFAVSWSKSF